MAKNKPKAVVLDDTLPFDFSKSLDENIAMLKKYW
jgi:hypothetical protein